MDFQIWDKDLLDNEFLSSCTIDFWDLIEEALRSETRIKMYRTKKKRKKEKFYVETTPNPNLMNNELSKKSKIKISVEIVPREL